MAWHYSNQIKFEFEYSNRIEFEYSNQFDSMCYTLDVNDQFMIHDSLTHPVIEYEYLFFYRDQTPLFEELNFVPLRPKKPRANPASNRVRVRAAFSVLGSTRQPNDYDCRGWNWEIQKINKIEKADKTRKIIGSGAKVLKEHLSLSKEALVDIHIWS
ncbi:hypothetical protein PSTG_01148 [Puccinia striiformis f. sp. tritici PST-78]|uniref:Uncharacterized protein n=1 Tax=Puccinia striiformis f. sp. tritici PST-78 TaxID=1165861 RepID=A0A0L0W2K9_9BASI|nr:hypothetical protein PSTG_01148 [Puccinia striiformis f. sp. tritici PST-78]